MASCDMLWQKGANGIYVNICQEILEQKLFEKANYYYGIQSGPTKSNNDSLKYRKIGNLQFASEEWLHAIKSYNVSLCFAVIGSEHMSLAYGNRSACFLHLNMFEECLTDIELAIAANFPARLLPKLEKRKADCLERIRNGGDRAATLGREIDFKENPNYPGVANVLNVQVSAKFGRHITASSDIGAGKILIAEKAFLTKCVGTRNRCDSCWKSNVNLVPCSRCTSALFCPDQCEASRYHTIQCGIRIVHDEIANDNQMQLVRSVLMAISEFDSTENLMEFVELAVRSDPNEIPESLLDTKSKYRAFLKLSFDRKTTVKETFTTQISFIWKTLITHRVIRPQFSTNKHQRLVMHLIGHHLCVVQCNTGALMYDAESPFNIAQSMTENLSLLVNYINHSCVPNLSIISSDDLNICTTLRPKRLWQEASVRNHDLIEDPKLKVPGFEIPRKAWVRLNRIRTGHGSCNHFLHLWNLTNSTRCDCGATDQTMMHIVNDCPIRKFSGGIESLNRLDDGAIDW